MNREEYVPCPHCGDDIRANANFCRHCGSSESDGWSDDSGYQGDSDFDYDDFVDREFGDDVSHALTNKKTKAHWRLVAVILLLLFFLFVAMGF